MRVSILGAGAMACSTAAYLASVGHDPMLWSPSGASTQAFAAGQALVTKGALQTSCHPRVADSCEQAVAQADVVMVCVPASGHKRVLDAAAPFIRDDQAVIISSHVAFGALYLHKLLARRQVAAPVIAWGTTLTAGSKVSATEVLVKTVRSRIDIAAVPEQAEDRALALCRELFGDRFAVGAGIVAIVLSNVNPQNHLAICLLNLTRMEHGETWSQGENITASAGRLIEALDLERVAIARALGVQVRTVRQHFELSFPVTPGSVHDMSQQMVRLGIGGFGPSSIHSRHITDDIPFGLITTLELARLAGVSAPLHQAGVALMSAACGKDFRPDNNLLQSLDLAVDLPAHRQPALA